MLEISLFYRSNALILGQFPCFFGIFHIKPLDRPIFLRENVSYVNSVCSFFTSYYERPEDLDLVEFLRYMGIGGARWRTRLSSRP